MNLDILEVANNAHFHFNKKMCGQITYFEPKIEDDNDKMSKRKKVNLR